MTDMQNVYSQILLSEFIIAKNKKNGGGEIAQKFNRGLVKWIAVIYAVDYYRIIKEKADFSLEDVILSYLLTVVSLGKWDRRLTFMISVF